MATTPDKPETTTGEFRWRFEPSPNWPEPLAPHDQTVPSAFSAWLEYCDVDTAPVTTKSARRTALGVADALHAFTFTTIDRTRNVRSFIWTRSSRRRRRSGGQAHTARDPRVRNEPPPI